MMTAPEYVDRRDADDATFAAEVPTNTELAERAKGLDAHAVVRNWLNRHVGPLAWIGSRDEWLDWAAENFLADPEIAQHLTATPPAPGTDERGPMRGNPPFEHSPRCDAADPEDCRKLGCDTRVAAPGTDSSGQAVQRDEWGCRCWPYDTPPPVGHKHFANGCTRQPAVAGPQRHHDEEGS